jgi:hypothetical protein
MGMRSASQPQWTAQQTGLRLGACGASARQASGRQDGRRMHHAASGGGSRQRGATMVIKGASQCGQRLQLVSPLAQDEPNDIEWVYGHLDDLAKRWATLNQQYKADTVTTYQSRAKAALEDYFRWQKDPTTFRFRERVPRPERRDAKAESNTERPVATSVSPQEAEWEPVGPGVISSAFRIGSGREFRFVMPENVSVADVRRIAAHLLTYAEDWDPIPTESFAIVRQHSP